MAVKLGVLIKISPNDLTISGPDQKLKKAVKKIKNFLEEVIEGHSSHFLANKRECELLNKWLTEDHFKSKYEVDIKWVAQSKADGPL